LWASLSSLVTIIVVVLRSGTGYPFSSFFCYVFSSTKLENKRAEQVLPRSRGGEWVAQIIYTHISECKNDKIKLKKSVLHEKKLTSIF
jgi:hypothetical protein